MDKKTIEKAKLKDVWETIVKNYEFVKDAHMSNSFIILMALNQIKRTNKHNSNIRKNCN